MGLSPKGYDCQVAVTRMKYPLSDFFLRNNFWIFHLIWYPNWLRPIGIFYYHGVRRMVKNGCGSMMMTNQNVKVVACKKCHSLFQTLKDTDYCPICSLEINKLFNKVKKYIRDNNRAGIHEVSEACSVNPKWIIQWVREERLYFTEESEIAIPCLQCGTKISTGKYCDHCRKTMSNNMTSLKRSFKPVDETKRDGYDDTFVKVKTNERLRFTRTNS